MPRSRSQQTPLVIIVWANSLDAARELLVNVLSNGDGSPRVYERGHVDARCGETRYAPTVSALRALLEQAHGSANPVELPLRVAMQVGLA